MIEGWTNPDSIPLQRQTEAQPVHHDFEISEAEPGDLIKILNFIRLGEREYNPAFSHELKSLLIELINSHRDIRQLIFNDYFSPSFKYKHLFQQEQAIYYNRVIYYNGQTAGVILAMDKLTKVMESKTNGRRVIDPRGVYIRSIYLNPQHTGNNRKGLGTRLLDQLIQDLPNFSPTAKSLYLHVHPQNYNTINAYLALGFQILYKEKSVRHPNLEFILMKKEI
jgi:ribosomal protein S18 acetylase RimI-like enzyme